MSESPRRRVQDIAGASECVRLGRRYVRVPTRLTGADRWGTVKARLGVGRMDYRIEPGLYAVGAPDGDSEVLVTANYKLTFDALRKELGGLNVWIVVLDTDGINVWCAAGKGTFGTEELTRRVEALDLGRWVNHRRLIVGQLGAVGVAAHEVRKATGFGVLYGPVRAADIKAFLAAGREATEAMRQVRFSLTDRLVLTPVEVRLSLKYLLYVLMPLLAVAGFHRGGYCPQRQLERGLRAFALSTGAYLIGAVVGPALLPWLPGRCFAVKGAVVGMAAAVVAVVLGVRSGLEAWAWVLLGPAIASFMTMNFTGASTYTSLSGVRKETRAAVPLQIAAAVIGVIVFAAAGFVGGSS